MSNFKIKISEFNTSNLIDLAASLSKAFSYNGATGIVFSSMNIGTLNNNNLLSTGINVGNITGNTAFFTGINVSNITGNTAFFTGINVGNITGNTAFFNSSNVYLTSFLGTGILNNIPDNSYIASPQLPLVNSSYTGVMSFTFPQNKSTVLGFTANLRAQSLTGPSIQAYMSQFQLLAFCSGTNSVAFTISNATPIQLNSPPGNFTISISGTTAPNTLHLLLQPVATTV